MTIRVKPFTLFLCIVTILFLFFAPLFLKEKLRGKDPIESIQAPEEKWTGVLNFWELTTWETGRGNRIQWLNHRIREFENRHPGVFIELRSVKPATFQLYMQSPTQNKEIWPDMISFGPGMIKDPSAFLEPLDELVNDQIREELVQASGYRKKTMALPWMMGSYALMANRNACEQHQVEIPEQGGWNYDVLLKNIGLLAYERKGPRKSIQQIHGLFGDGGPYRFPLLSMMGSEDFFRRWTGSGKLPAELLEGGSLRIWEAFVQEKRINMIITSQKEIYRMKALRDQGKGFEYAVMPLPAALDDKEALYNDQVQFIAMVRQQKEKQDLSRAFIELLLSSDSQNKLSELGVFPVIPLPEPLYKEDEWMGVLEKSTQHPMKVPNAFLWTEIRTTVSQTIRKTVQGDQRSAGELSRLLSQSLKAR